MFFWGGGDRFVPHPLRRAVWKLSCFFFPPTGLSGCLAACVKRRLAQRLSALRCFRSLGLSPLSSLVISVAVIINSLIWCQHSLVHSPDVCRWKRTRARASTFRPDRLPRLANNPRRTHAHTLACALVLQSSITELPPGDCYPSPPRFVKRTLQISHYGLSPFSSVLFQALH